jgi:hypothetical protein
VSERGRITVADGKYDEQITAMQRQIDQLQRENQTMQTALTEVANANVLPTVLQNGFADVIAELRPLRDLTPQRESLERPIAAALAAMLEAMEGVTLAGDSLKIPPVNVPFIGEPRPDLPSTPGSGGEPLPYPGQPDPYKTPDQTIQQQPFRGGRRP